jgi:hypothetical protein
VSIKAHVNTVASIVSTAITTVLVAGKQATAAVSKDLVVTDLGVQATLKVAVVPSEDEVVLVEAVVAIAADVDHAADAADSIRAVRDLAQQSLSLHPLASHRFRGMVHHGTHCTGARSNNDSLFPLSLSFMVGLAGM